MYIPFRKKQPLTVVDWLKKRLYLIFDLFLTVLLLSIGVSLYAFNSQRTLDNQKVVLHEDADQILRTMIDQDTGLRGYISTNDSAFLEPFRQGRPAYLAALQDFNSQIQSGPFRHTAVRLAVMQDVADDWYTNYAIAQLDAMRTGNLADPRSRGSIVQGKVLFDRFRTAVDQLQEAIEQDLEAYQNQVDTINLSLVIGAIALTLLLSTILWWIMRTFTRQLHIQLECLTQTTQRLGQGKRAARVVPLPYTDLNQVGQSFNHMADALQQQQDSLEHAMHTLERQYVLVEQAQSESRAIFDASSEAFLFVSASGQVHALNRPFLEFFALPSQDVVGMPLTELQHQWEPLFVDPASLHSNLVQDMNNQGRRYTMTVTQKNPHRELSVYSAPVPSSTNAYLGRLYVLRDITRELEAERQKLKSEFYSMVSHGLRSPLTSIRGYTDLLLEKEIGSLTELQQEFLNIVHGNVQRMLALVNDLLDLSRLESRSSIVHTEPLDLHYLIHEITQTLRPQVEARQQELSLHLTPSPLTVLGDENRVEQILSNLLTFAINHTPIEGRIDWETQDEDSMVRITLHTTGTLSEEELALFDRPFFDASRVPHRGGSLLGPSITRSLLELHGGTLHVTSEPEKGTTFTCTLPLAPSQASTFDNSSPMPAENRV